MKPHTRAPVGTNIPTGTPAGDPSGGTLVHMLTRLFLCVVDPEPLVPCYNFAGKKTITEVYSISGGGSAFCADQRVSHLGMLWE